MAGTGGTLEAEGTLWLKAERGSAWAGPELGTRKQDGQGSWGPENARCSQWQLPKSVSPPGRGCSAEPCVCPPMPHGLSPGPESCPVAHDYSSPRATSQDRSSHKNTQDINYVQAYIHDIFFTNMKSTSIFFTNIFIRIYEYILKCIRVDC